MTAQAPDVLLLDRRAYETIGQDPDLPDDPVADPVPQKPSSCSANWSGTGRVYRILKGRLVLADLHVNGPGGAPIADLNAPPPPIGTVNPRPCKPSDPNLHCAWVYPGLNRSLAYTGDWLAGRSLRRDGFDSLQTFPHGYATTLLLRFGAGRLAHRRDVSPALERLHLAWRANDSPTAQPATFATAMAAARADP